MRYYLLDVFRGFAALWVFTFHLGLAARLDSSIPFLANFFANGWLGVQMFFVISGYCLMASVKTALRNQESKSSFLLRRAKRVYITFWFSIILVAALPFIIEFISSLKTGQFVAPTSSKTTSYGYLDYSFFDWLRLITLTQVFYPMQDIINLEEKFNTINAVYWTLAIEVQFYIIIALGMYFKKKIYTFLLLATIASATTLLIPNFHLTGFFSAYWHCFALGILLFYLFEREIKPSLYIKNKILRKTISIALCMFTITAVSSSEDFSPDIFVFLFAISIWSLEVYELSYREQIQSKKKVFLTLEMLGMMSYTIYLIHGKLLHLVSQFVRQVLEVGSISYFIVVFVGTILCCYPFYLLCEKPFFKRKVK